jgi:hypothetical protein
MESPEAEIWTFLLSAGCARYDAELTAIEGWKAVYNEQYKERFYVNIYTKMSQWRGRSSTRSTSGGFASTSAGGGHW